MIKNWKRISGTVTEIENFPGHGLSHVPTPEFTYRQPFSCSRANSLSLRHSYQHACETFRFFIVGTSSNFSRFKFWIKYIIKILKARRFEIILRFDNSQSIVTRGSRVSRAPPHHTLPAFFNLNGKKIYHRKFKTLASKLAPKNQIFWKRQQICSIINFWDQLHAYYEIHCPFLESTENF